ASTQYQVDGGSWQNGTSFSEGTDGTHTLVFRTTDVAGNTTSAAPVTVTVDRTAPIPDASLAPASPNGANGWYVSPVTVTANSSDATSGLASQGVSLDGSTWTASLTVLNDGTSTVQVSAKDNAGNTASTTKTIKLDTTPPTASLQIPAPDGAGGWFVSPVTVTVSGTDVTSGVGSQMVSLDGTTWVSSLTLSTDGVYSVRGRVTDNAGNTTTTSPVTVSVDRTAPILGMTLSPAAPNGTNSWYVSPVTVSADSSDATSGIADQAVSLDGKTWEPSVTISPDGTSTVQVQAADKAGNTASSSQTIHLDATPPTASFVLPAANGNNGWYLSPVTVSAVGTDATSGVASQQVSLDGSSWVSSLTLSTDGVYTVHGRVTDNAGNTTSITRTVGVDHTPPVVGTPVLTGTPGLAGWYTSSVGVSVPATDATSGVASILYSVDGGAWQTTAPTLTDGVHTVQIVVTDKAGNVSSTSVSAAVDATPPVSAFISPAEGSTTNISGNQEMHLTGSTSDATSGVAGAEISLDDGATWQNLPLGAGDGWVYDWNGLRSNGTYVFLVRATDNAGNLEHPAKVTIVVGNQAPKVSITPLWLDFGSASVSINTGSLPIAGASITVKDPKDRWPEAVFSYAGSALPTKFTWLGRMGDGSIATIGKYQVTVKAWDAFGNTGSASGWVLIPLPPPQPTATPAAPTAPPPTAAASTPVNLAAVVLAATPTPTPAPTVLPTQAPPPPPAAPAKPTSSPWWPATFIGSLFVLFLSVSLLDPRPAAWRRLARIKAQIP
ncbi:MAG: Ig-like domain-containing protein, partial [Methanoregula sp.]|uniref:OmpL47-type beta-barrel domain-containing protein n=1 Tax=Methanoregula sp. TaxID=2052170 RepID=UPI003D0B9700